MAELVVRHSSGGNAEIGAQMIAQAQPVGRIGTPDEIAEAVWMGDTSFNRQLHSWNALAF